MQEQLVCRGCRITLLYPRGAPNVRCSLCNTLNKAPLHLYPPPPPPPHHHHHPHGMDRAYIVCGGCQTTLMYTRGRGATSVRCSCCQTINLVPAPPPPCNQFANINCGNCRTTLVYPYGASSVKCALCQFVTNVNMGNGRVPNMPNGAASPGTMPSTSTLTPPSKTQTVVVENPMSVNESGKLVSNVVVGVTTCKK